ncbi:hypothetical protein [Streptomyces sp. NPDC005385]|uniref:hypothetical protein n=1 Tax=unclassified Streptomyces TaxID=2593676 RepID=UPI0033B22B44
MAHYSGDYASATTGGQVVYESRLELARLLLADFDPSVCGMLGAVTEPHDAPAV